MEEGETDGRCNAAAALRAALPTRRRESGTRGGLNGQDKRWRKAKRTDGATLLRLLEPRSEDAEAGPHASVRNRVHGRVTGPFPFRLRQGYGATNRRDESARQAPRHPKGRGNAGAALGEDSAN